MKPRITEKKLKRAAQIAKAENVNVRINRDGEFIIEPRPEAANDRSDLDAERLEALMDETMGPAKR